MKNKLILTVGAALGMVATVKAQNVSVGPRVGITMATIHASGDTPEGYESKSSYRAGLQFGAVANVAINERLSVQPEFLYLQKGTKNKSKQLTSDFTFEGDTQQKNTYLELPILAKVYFGNGKVLMFATAGPTFGYWIKSRIKAKLVLTEHWAGGEDEVHQNEFDMDVDFSGQQQELVTFPEYNRVEAGGTVGVGLASQLGAGTMNLDLRYGAGLSGITKLEDEDGKATNRLWGLSVAYLFSL
ncbi:porin family protein [Pontibacter mangrovi]|uniref:PorT family protein n=1 Tax=Pontibacter mangrovi TaxID=2589816 RepID=A0A501W805_9BACT|nr:porin family protein [Pontibacter mangrovi]TPE44490.1 PorT family protein [Pontibacter mangrovi]